VYQESEVVKMRNALITIKETLRWYKVARDHWDWDNLFEDIEKEFEEVNEILHR